jgi:FixJ family two-component response regulator
MSQNLDTDGPDKVYVIDPDESVHDALRTLLGSSGYRVT